ncbi:MAG TPA: ribosome-binding factor A, partial [Flavobacteriaceae bacterium]|nr:ribosome-binding factor A [Flavobacteriaceae bacterium]
QKDLIDILQGEAREWLKGVIISITKVYVTSDLGEAKIYVSVFPSKHRERLMGGIKKNTNSIRYELARRTKNQLRRMPNLEFFIDDSLDYIEGIDSALKGTDVNPIKNPDVLPKRQKR